MNYTRQVVILASDDSSEKPKKRRPALSNHVSLSTVISRTETACLIEKNFQLLCLA